MHWTEEGRIQVTKKFAIGATAAFVGLALVMMLFAGMLISGDGDSVPRVQADPTSNEQSENENEDRDISIGDRVEELVFHLPSQDLEGNLTGHQRWDRGTTHGGMHLRTHAPRPDVMHRRRPPTDRSRGVPAGPGDRGL